MAFNDPSLSSPHIRSARRKKTEAAKKEAAASDFQAEFDRDDRIRALWGRQDRPKETRDQPSKEN